MKGSFSDLFKTNGRYNIGLLTVFFLINGIVLVNACLHDPRINYDGKGHLKNIQALSEGHLPTPADSREFFCPPLPYAVPVLAKDCLGLSLFQAEKLAQCTNVLLSLGLILCLLKICHLLSPRPALKFGTLLLLGILPVYYKTFAYIRGEPYVAFFATVILYRTLAVLIEDRFTVRQGIVLGAAMGLCILSRQWGMLVLPGVFLVFLYKWWTTPPLRMAITRFVFVCLAVLVIVGGWFYLSLAVRYGSVTAFNQKPHDHLSIHNQPGYFYEVWNPQMARHPIRPNLADRFLPIFYSEVWGDYWGYFLIAGKKQNEDEFISGRTLSKLSSGKGIPADVYSNYGTMGAYLGRVNVVSLFPSALILVSLLMSIGVLWRKTGDCPSPAMRKDVHALLLLVLATSICGYLWFLLMYPSVEKGDTIKASYMLQIFPPLALLAGLALERVKTASPVWFRLIVLGLILTFIHNFGAVITRYSSVTSRF